MRIPRDCYANLVTALSHEIRASVVRIFTCRELVAEVLNMFKNWMRFFPQNISQDCRATVVRQSARLSCDSRATFMRMSRTCRSEILANLQCEIFVTLVQMSCECRASVARRSRDSLETTREKLATIWRENKT